MRNVSILIEVSDDIYDMVVEPHKKNKTFGKLMASLLDGYIKDDYVNAYAEGTLEEMRKASVDSLDSVIGDMHKSLSNLGLFTNELKSTTNKGKEIFEKKATDTSAELPSMGVPETDSAMKEDVDKLKQDISEMREQNSQILQLLMKMSQGGVSIIAKEEETIKEVAKDSIKDFVEDDINDDFSSSSLPDLSFVDNEEEQEVDMSFGKDILNSMLAGNQYSF